MQNKKRDETRWLARLLAVFVVMLGVRILSIMVHRVSEGTLLPLTAILSLGVSAFLFWVGYRFLMCPSLWDMFGWVPTMSPFVLYTQAQYFRINAHIRAGLIGGLAFWIIEAFVYVMHLFHRDIGFYGELIRLWHRVCWPHRGLMELLQISQWPTFAVFLLVIFYLFLLGFLTGCFMSYLAGRIRQRQSDPKAEGFEV